MKSSHILSINAVCRECAKEFGYLGSSRALTIRIMRHIKKSPGHTVIGVQTNRIVYKRGSSCTAR